MRDAALGCGCLVTVAAWPVAVIWSLIAWDAAPVAAVAILTAITAALAWAASWLKARGR